MRTGLTRVIFLALIGCFIASTATAAVYLDQTRSFSLSAPGGTLAHYEGQPYTLPVQAGPYNESTRLSFLGAPPTSLVVQGEDYALTGVTLSLASTLSVTYGVDAYDSDWFSDCHVKGTVFTALQASLNVPSLSQPFHAEHEWQGEAGTATTFIWIVWLVGEPDFTFTSRDGGTQSLSHVYNETRSYAIEPFLQQEIVSLDMSKAINLSLLDFIPDDNYDLVSNSRNQWTGSVTLRYVYDLAPDPVPTPVPPAFLLLGSGLGAFAMLRTKTKKGRPGRKAILPLCFLGLAFAILASPASAQTFTWADVDLLQQSRAFNLSQTIPSATYGMGNDHNMIAMDQRFNVSFDVAPQSYIRMGVEYRLTGIEAVVDSTFTSQYHLSASDSWYSRAWANGGGAAYAAAYLSIPSFTGMYGTGTPTDPVFQLIDSTQLAVDKSGFFPPHPEVYSYYSTAIDETWLLFDTTSLSQLFSLGLTSIPLTFQKRVAVALGAHADDVTDEGEMANTISIWQGSVTLNYRYSAYVPPPTPTPVPPAFLLLASGLCAAGILRSRRKK